jgi:hypothetical protein
MKSFEDITAALRAAYNESKVARATHYMYAYRLTTGSGTTIHLHDDREHMAGKLMLIWGTTYGTSQVYLNT